MCLKLRSEVDLGALWVPPSSDLSKLQSLEEHHSVLPHQPSAGAHKSPLSLSHPGYGTSPPAIPGKAVPAQHGKPEVVLFCPASLGAMLLHAAQSSCSAGEDLALRFMAGVHTELLLRALGTDRRGCVHSHTSEYLFGPLQTASLAGARLSASHLLQQERKHGSRSQGLLSFSSAAGIESLLGLTWSFNLFAFSSLAEKGQRSWIWLGKTALPKKQTGAVLESRSSSLHRAASPQQRQSKVQGAEPDCDL